MPSKDYKASRERIYALRDEGKFLQAIEASQLFSEELQQDLSNTNEESAIQSIKLLLSSTYYIQGALLRQIRNYFQSDSILAKGLAIAEEINDIQLIAKIYSALANNKFQNGYLEQTLVLLQKGYEVIKDSKFYFEKVMIQGNIGQTLNTLGEFDAAEHIISTMLSELEKLGMDEYIGNAYFSLGEYKYNQGLYKDALHWYSQSIDNFFETKKLKNLYFSYIHLIRTYIQLGDIETAEKTIEELNKVQFEGKGDKEELEKLLLFINIFIYRKDYSIAKYSIDTVAVNLDSNEMIDYKAMFLFQRAVIHCLETEPELALTVIAHIFESVKEKEYIVYRSQLNYIEAWALYLLQKVDEAKQILFISFKRSKGRLLLAGMFYIPKDIQNFLRKEQLSFKEKQQS